MSIRYLLIIFLRRLPYFLFFFLGISAIAVIVSRTLPPVYESRMRLIVESPQIPSELASPTTVTPALEQLQIVEQRLMTRKNLLDIADRLNMFEGEENVSADLKVGALRAGTTIVKSARRNEAALMTVAFEASNNKIAAAVVNEYLTLIQKEDVERRTVRATQTLKFFEVEVERLNQALAEKTAEILQFKLENAESLPESLDFRLNQQTLAQERLGQLNRDIAGLNLQRDKLLATFEETGRVTEVAPEKKSSRDELYLEELETQLSQALAVFAPDNPNVKVLEARIVRVKETIARQKSDNAPIVPESEDTTGNRFLDIQLAEIESRLTILGEQRTDLEEQLGSIATALANLPANSIKLDELELDLGNLQAQYTAAVNSFSSASTGERIEHLARGQKISVIEPPVVPQVPTKPNRSLIAIGGIIAGLLAGLGVVVLLEFLNKSVRRPEDLINKLGIEPLVTLPYIRTARQRFVQRAGKVMIILAVLVGVPGSIYVVHNFYFPLDLLAAKVMNKVGI